MPEKHAGGLNLRIGLTLSQLQSDFLTAEQTVRQGVAALNRQQNLVKLRMDTDITGLDAVIDKTKILEVQERGLTQLLDMQRDKLALVTAAYRDWAASKGANDVGSKKLEASMERERLAVVRLEAELKNLAAQKISLDTSRLQDNISRITAQIQHVRIKAEFDTSALSGANAAFDAQKIHIAAVTRELELQRQKLIQLRAAMFESAQRNGGESVQTINIKSNVLTQMQEIQRLEQKLKELQSTDINLKIRADNVQKAEQTINESIARLNAKIEHVRVKAEVDVSKLGAAAGEFDKAKVHVSALNRELELQTQKLRELQKAFATSVSTNGLNHVKTINLGTDIQRQIREIDQLKAKLDELNKVKPPNGLLNGYLNIKGDIAGKLNNITTAFSGVASASHSADGAISKSLEIIGAIPHPAGKAVAALAAIPLVIKGIESSLLSMAESVVASGDAFYVMSRGMQLSIADAAQLSTIAKVTGIEINEVNASMRRFSMQLTKGGEKSSLMAQTLKRYGAELTDETGRMKNELELAQELGKAFRAAQEEGNGAAFRDIVGGKFWSGDFVTFLEDLADNTEAAKQVVKNGLANPAFAHQIQGEINTLNAQLGQLGGVFESALLPVVHEIVPRMTARFGELTKVIQANKENIRFFGDALALPVRAINELTDGFISLSNAIDEAKDKGTVFGQIFAAIGNYRDDVAALMNVAPTTALTAFLNPSPGTTGRALVSYRKAIDEYKRAQEEAAKAAEAKKDEAAARHANTLALNKANLEAQQKLENALATTEERKIKLAQEAEDIIYGIRHSSYEKQLRDLERWEEEQLNSVQELQELAKNVLGQENLFDDEENAVYELGNAKRLQIEEEKEQRLAEIRQRITEGELSEAERRMTAIDAEKEKWIQAGMERAEAEQLAQEKTTKAYQQQENKLNEIRDSVASLYRTDLENKLAAIDKEQKAWVEAGLSEAEAAELASQKKQKAYEEDADKAVEEAQRQADAKAKAEEDYQKKVQAAQEEADRKNKAARDEALNVLKSEAKEFKSFLEGGEKALQENYYKKLIKSGASPELIKAMTPEKLEAYKSAKDKAQSGLMPNWEDPFSAKPVTKSLQEIPKAADATTKSLNNVANAAHDAAQTLTNTSKSMEQNSVSANGSEDNQPERGAPVGAYENPDGSTSVENIYTDVKKSLQDLGEQSARTAEQMAKIPDTAEQGYNQSAQTDLSSFDSGVQSATTSLGELSTAVQGATETLSEMVPPEKMVNPLSELEPEIQTAVQQYSDMNVAVSEVNLKFSDLSTAISNFVAKISELAFGQEQQQPQAVNVNNTVQIEEAHAWDYDHIQELAEKVATIITPVIIRAIGGDSNSY